jgi:hypothetical protein
MLTPQSGQCFGPILEEKRKSRWRRRLKWPLIVFGVLFVIVYVILPAIATPIIRNRLQKQLSSQLDADLQMGTVYYWFPYGVTVSDAVLVAKDQQGEAIRLLKIDKLKLALARLPFGDGPLVIQKLILIRPEIHLLDTDEGLVGRHSLVKSDAPSPAAEASQPPPATAQSTQPAPSTTPAIAKTERRKLSEMLELREVRIEDAQIVYEDRKSPQSVPAAWRHINIDMATTPAANPVYEFDFTASNGPLAEMRIAGTINVDELEVSLKQITAKLDLAAPTSESPVPASVQRMLLNNNVRGSFAVSGNAFMPLRKMEETTFDLQMTLKDGATRIGKIHSDRDPDDDTFDSINAKVHWSTEPLTEEQAFMDTAGEMRAAKAAAAVPPKDVGAKKKVPAVYMLLQEAEIFMGDNRLEMKNAALAFDRRLKQWEFRNVHGTLSLGENKGELPKPLRAAFEKPQFFGVVAMVLDGLGSMAKPKDGSRRPYQLHLKATCPQLIMSSRRLVASNVSCNMLMTPGLIQFVDENPQSRAISAAFYGGSLVGVGAIRTGSPAHFDFAGAIEKVDLRALGQDWSRTEATPSKASGRAFANLRLGWSNAHAGKSSLDLLTSDGTFEILDGEFYELPVLSQIAAAIPFNKDAGKVGQAAARFTIANQEIQFKPLAVSAPMLGLHGQGKISFDGQLDFKAVAAPLADWKNQLQKSKIPLLDSVGAELAGGIQKVLDSTTGKLLYQFKITGNRSKPVVTPEAVPILTEDGMNLLKNMINGTGRLLDSI